MADPRTTPANQTWQDKIDALAYGDVEPLLLVTDVHYRDQLEVEVALVPMSEVGSGGYASLPLMTRAYDSPSRDQDHVAVIRECVGKTVVEFSSRLRAFLAQR